MYHDASRSLQDRELIESRAMFFLATADAGGWPDRCNKGGRPGFVRVNGVARIDFADPLLPSLEGAQLVVRDYLPRTPGSGSDEPRRD